MSDDPFIRVFNHRVTVGSERRTYAVVLYTYDDSADEIFLWRTRFTGDRVEEYMSRVAFRSLRWEFHFIGDLSLNCGKDFEIAKNHENR